MQTTKFLAFATCWFFTGQVLEAAIFERDLNTQGDGLLTYDDVNRREWLDLTETLDWSLDDLYDAIAPHGPLRDFSPATVEDIAGLAASAGVEWLPPGRPFPVAEGNSAANLIDLLGTILDYSNRSDPGDVIDVGSGVDFGDLHEFNILETLRLRAAAGLAVYEPSQDGLFALIAVIRTGGSDTPGMTVNNPLRSSFESGGILSDLQAVSEPILGPFWLFRTAVVPEPTSLALAVTFSFAILLRRHPLRESWVAPTVVRS